MQEQNAPRLETNRAFAIGLVLLVLAIVLVFSPALTSDFAFDDDASNAWVREFTSWKDIFGSDAFGLFRPMKNLHAWALNSLQASVPVWHLVNLLAYGLAACGVSWLIRHMTGSVRWGLLGGAIWAFAATGVTVAVWISCFNISIAIAAVTAATVIHDRNTSENRRWPWSVLAGLCWLIGLLSYETSVALVLIVPALEWIRGRRWFHRDAWLRYACFAVAGTIWLTLRIQSGAIVQGMQANPANPPDLQPWQQAVSAPYFLWTHLLMWLSPWKRIEFMSSYVWNESVPAIVHPFCWLLLFGVIVMVFSLKRRSPLAAFGLAWFLLGSFPSGNFIPVGNTPFADYYVPFPSIGLVILLIAAVRSLLALRHDDMLPESTRRFATVIALLLLGSRVAQLFPMATMIDLWKRPTLVLTASCQVRPYQFYAKAILSRTLCKQGDMALAEIFAEEARTEGPHLSTPYITLGEVRDSQGKTDEAISCFEQALVLRHTEPKSPEFLRVRLGELYGSKPGRLGQAVFYLLPILERRQSTFHVRAILAEAKALEVNDKRSDSIEILRKGLSIHPDDPDLLKERTRLESVPAKP